VLLLLLLLLLLLSQSWGRDCVAIGRLSLRPCIALPGDC
jgi:hypothetical protein